MCRDMPPLEQAIQFHGHICPGILMGVRAAEFALKHLEVDPDIDEQLIAVVETDSCGVDAIQVILGCTFGKGNLIHKDYGKAVYTIGSREKNRAVRIAQKFGATASPNRDRFRELKMKKNLNEEEKAEMEGLLGDIFEQIMSMPFEDLFKWEDVPFDFPARARIYPTIQCEGCGEGVMEPRAKKTEQGMLCPSCQIEFGGVANV